MSTDPVKNAIDETINLVVATNQGGAFIKETMHHSPKVTNTLLADSKQEEMDEAQKKQGNTLK